MKSISTILRETKVKQIKGNLVMFNQTTHEVEGKCAMGVLSCEIGKTQFTLTENGFRPLMQEILSEYGIDSVMQKGVPSIGYKFQSDSSYKFTDLDYNKYSTIAEQIIALNDCFDYTFKEIAEFLEITYGL